MKILLLAKNKEWADFWIHDNHVPKKLVYYISQPRYAHGLRDLPYVVYGFDGKIGKIAEILSWGNCYKITTKQAKEMVMRTIEEDVYLSLTRRVNELKNQINETEKEKSEANDKLRELIKKIDALDEEYSKALNDMLSASGKVK